MSMYQSFFFAYILLFFNNLNLWEPYQLAPPLVKYDAIFFDDSTSVTLKFAQAGTTIHYTLNGKEPTPDAPVYVQPIIIKKKQTTLKAKVFGANFRPSETVSTTFYPKGAHIESITHSAPHPNYSGSGPNTLVDGNGGWVKHNSKTWMGFQQDSFSATLQFAKAFKTHRVVIHALNSTGAWIFLPKRAEVWARHPKSGHWVLLGTNAWPADAKNSTTGRVALEIAVHRPIKTNEILVMAVTLPVIPDWHPGKGQRPWLFLEEIGVY